MDRQSTSASTSNRPPSASHNNLPASLAANGPNSLHRLYTTSPVLAPNDAANPQPSRDNCDRRRPDEEDISRLPAKMPSNLVGKTVTPFLREHIPGTYAPIGKPETKASVEVRKGKDPNSKYCYRHRPDSKCRRTADESKMVLIQSELDKLPTADQQAITHVWSLFSAAPAKHRDLMLSGIITQCCFPQLSTVSREVHEQLKIDFLTALPVEISYKVLRYLDTVSLCKAAQVSRRWKSLADDDVVWHRMCAQHLNRKCVSCGWGLPLLERKRLQDWSAEQQASAPHQHEPPSNSDVEPEPVSNGSNKRELVVDSESRKRPRINGVGDQGSQPTDTRTEAPKKFRPWKAVYRERFKVGSNWKYGRCRIQSFRGHSNGVTCLQFDEKILATGSYDATIKIWDIKTGQELRTLRGHTMGIRALQFDGHKLFSGSLDNTVRVWNWQTGECLSELQCHTAGVITVDFDGRYLASGSIDTTVKVLDFDSKETFCLRGHGDWVNQVRLDSPSRTLFSASDDCTVKLWDLKHKICLRAFEGHVGQVQQILPMPDDFEPEEASVPDSVDTASVSSGRSSTPSSTVNRTSSSSQEQLATPGDDRSAYGVTFTSDESRTLPPRYFMTAALDNTIKLWETATGKCLRTAFGHIEGIWGLAGDSLRIVTGANDSMVKIWDPRSGKCERSFTGHAGPVTCVGLSDSRMASGGEDGEVRLYSFEAEEPLIEAYGTPA